MSLSSKNEKTVRVPPHSLDAEESVLGALLLDKNAIVDVAELLKPEHFYLNRHQQIYESIVSLYEERSPIDILTVAETLKKRKLLKKGEGREYLKELLNKVPSASHIEEYAKIVKELAVKRSLMEKASRLVDLSLDEGVSAGDLLDKAESEIFSLTQASLIGSFTPVRVSLADSFDRLDELHKMSSGLRGVPTGFKDLDNLLAGFQRSNLIILAARPGVGKTSLALNIAQNLAVNEKRPAAMFSLEMSKEELVDRLLTSQADIDAWKLKTGKLTEEDFTSLSSAMGELAEAPFYIDDTPALSILEMRTKARRLQVEFGIDLLIVDYLQLARSRNLENRVQEVSEISQGLKNLARELKIPVIALSQLSRAVEQRGVKRPQLSDLRESGCLLGETLIIDAESGERRAISSLVGKENIKIMAMNEDLKIIPTQASRIFSSGKKMAYRLTLKSGRIIKASGNHPFLKISGWEKLDSLKIGDKIATPRILNIRGKKTISDNRLIVLAHLIGDGCYVKRQPLHYTNSELELINIVKKAAKIEFDIKPRIIKQKNWFHLFLSAGFKLTHGKRNPIVKWLDEDLKIYGQHSREKRIPKEIFTQPKEKITLFLKHLWATDGCIYIYHGKSKQLKSKNKVTIYYASGNRELVEDIAHLLLRLGIISTITSSSKTGYQDMWNVQIQGKEEQLKFLTIIGCVGKKADKVNEAILFLNGIDSNPNNDIIPKEVWNYIEEIRIENGLTGRQFHSQVGWAYSGTQRFNNGISRKRMNEIIKVLKNKQLKSLAESDIYWDEIKNIERIGIKEVFDMTVPGYRNFIANDIIVHNSIEQDADVVMFLWREDDEEPTPGKPLNFTLDIAKHRNGGLGNIKLSFHGDRIRFYPRETKREK